MPYEPLEEKSIYKHAEALADQIWNATLKFQWFEKRTVGVQLTRAADSIGANIAEAGGRFHPADVKNFLYFARGSLRETKYWLRRRVQRTLITTETFQQRDQELEVIGRELSGLINYQKQRRSTKDSTPNS